MADNTGIKSSFNLPFQEQIDFFQQKVKLPSEKYTDLWEGMHARAFVVAGATKEALVSDFFGAVSKAIEKGTGLRQFKEDFDSIVQKHGWEHNGSPGWRAKVIYETNMRTSYMSARYKQMTDPAVLKMRPFWEYRHGSSKVPRQDHLAWHGMVLNWDDPWWKEHYPPNGWGCSCSVFALSKRDLADEGKTVSSPEPEEPVKVEIGSGEDKRTVEVPPGIDPGWGYNVGEAAWGKPLADSIVDNRPKGEERWENLSGGDWKSEGRPEKVPMDEPQADLGRKVETNEELQAELRDLLGGPEKTIFFSKKPDFQLPVNINAETLGSHLPPDRAPFLPFLQETIEDPFEVWMSFERDKQSGLVALKTRFIKVHAVGDSEKGLMLVANAWKGILESWTVIPMRRPGELQKSRRGELFWGRS